jgi:lipoprotein-releasing system ATP-binding protein
MSNQDKILLQTVEIVKSFETNGTKVDVLNGVTMDIRAGEMVAVVGASGVGKSTLLHIMGGLERPDAGEVLYRGENIFGYHDEGLAHFRNQTVGFVFQFHHLLTEFNALENAMMPALIKGMMRDEAQRHAEAVLTRVGLQNRMQHAVGELSGGEQQRVAVARALIMGPAILLADEPTGNLDPKTGETIHDLLISLNREDGLTAVIVTHNMELAEKLSRKMTLVDGKAKPVARN